LQDALTEYTREAVWATGVIKYEAHVEDLTKLIYNAHTRTEAILVDGDTTAVSGPLSPRDINRVLARMMGLAVEPRGRHRNRGATAAPFAGVDVAFHIRRQSLCGGPRVS
jgi:hypothetical protein